MACVWWLVWLASEALLVVWQFKQASVKAQVSGSPGAYVTAVVAITTSTILTLLVGVLLNYFLVQPFGFGAGIIIFASWGWHCWKEFVSSWQAGQIVDMAKRTQAAAVAQSMRPPE